MRDTTNFDNTTTEQSGVTRAGGPDDTRGVKNPENTEESEEPTTEKDDFLLR